ncbi:MAG: chemotaxis response regulator protein-glutamate methylesterase [Proteobacteria bacterium]|nr:chemotaxis response regulator protein-glutamate methylesterase [Pseudomonadota bacterium]
MANDLRVMIVDDSIAFRRMLASVINSLPGVVVAGNASNGKQALDKFSEIEPDIVTLEVEMPISNGIETLRRLREKNPSCAVIMVSAFSSSSVKTTLVALEAGAIDFIAKAPGIDVDDSMDTIKRQIEPIIAALQTRQKLVSIISKKDPDRASDVTGVSKVGFYPTRLPKMAITDEKPGIVAIGASTGGPAALGEIIPQLPKDFPPPVVIVQHMPPAFTAQLAETLNKKSAITVVEARDRQSVKESTVYIAPGAKQMKLEWDVTRAGKIIRIVDDPPVNNCKPSASYLFDSVAQIYKKNAVGVILTGMGKDGVSGLREMKRHGAKIIAQNESTSTIFGMPMAAINAGVVDVVVPLQRIGEEIEKLCKKD